MNERLELRKFKLKNDLIDRVILSNDYQVMKVRIEKNLVLLNDKLTYLQQSTSHFKNYIQKYVPMSENLLEYYRKSDGATKKRIHNTIFADKLIFENGKVGVLVFTGPIKLILRISWGFRGSEQKKEVDFELSIVVTLTNNSIFRIYKLQPSPWEMSCVPSFELVRVWNVIKRNKRSILTFVP